eukprot:scaffold2930_cov105-Isochrysis_galbana.AAC.1
MHKPVTAPDARAVEQPFEEGHKVGPRLWRRAQPQRLQVGQLGPPRPAEEYRLDPWREGGEAEQLSDGTADLLDGGVESAHPHHHLVDLLEPGHVQRALAPRVHREVDRNRIGHRAATQFHRSATAADCLAPHRRWRRPGAPAARLGGAGVAGHVQVRLIDGDGQAVDCSAAAIGVCQRPDSLAWRGGG